MDSRVNRCEEKSRFQIQKLEERIAPCSAASGPPGQCGAGDPGHAPGESNNPGNSEDAPGQD